MDIATTFYSCLMYWKEYQHEILIKLILEKVNPNITGYKKSLVNNPEALLNILFKNNIVNFYNIEPCGNGYRFLFTNNYIGKLKEVFL
jgi:hypothetical protein